MRQSIGDQTFSIINHILLAIIAVVTIFPIYYVVIVSFTEPHFYVNRDYVLFPLEFSFSAYKFLLSGDAFPRAFGVSTLVTLVGTPLHLLVTSMLAYSLSRKRMMGRKAIGIFILITMLFHPGMIPNYIIVKNLALIDKFWALFLPTLTSGWSVILMRSFFESIPESLEEAAVIDGANDMDIWFRVVLPLSLPALAALGLFAAVGLWNTYQSGLLYINDYKKYPLQVVLRNMLSQPVSEGEFTDVKPPSEMLKMAAVVITSTPIVMVYPFLQKHFAKGVMLGSVKG